MIKYQVQFTLPVNNPENNVTKTVRKKLFTFFVPINHPNSHNMGLLELLRATERTELLTLSTGLNNTVLASPDVLSIKDQNNAA